MSYPERIVPDDTEPGIVALHLKRYAFAEPWCRGGVVLDLACGVGYGSAHLAAAATRVVGGDVDADAIAYATHRYGRDNVEFRVMDAAAIPLADASVDVVCSFETIEHLPDRDAYLAEVARVLRDDGVYLVSTPRAERTTDDPANPFHHVEYDPGDFETLVRRYFREVALYGQRRLVTRRHRALRRLDVFGLRRRIALPGASRVLVGSPPTTAIGLEDVVISRDAVERADEIVAVCTAPRRP